MSRVEERRETKRKPSGALAPPGFGCRPAEGLLQRVGDRGVGVHGILGVVERRQEDLLLHDVADLVQLVAGRAAVLLVRHGALGADRAAGAGDVPEDVEDLGRALGHAGHLLDVPEHRVVLQAQLGGVGDHLGLLLLDRHAVGRDRDLHAGERPGLLQSLHVLLVGEEGDEAALEVRALGHELLQSVQGGDAGGGGVGGSGELLVGLGGGSGHGDLSFVPLECV